MTSPDPNRSPPETETTRRAREHEQRGQAHMLANRFQDGIREYNQAGKTVLLTTHNMEEADALCQRLAIIDHGRVIAIDTPAGLKGSIPGGFLLRLRFAKHTPGLLLGLQSLSGVREVRSQDTTGADVYADRGGSLIPEIASLAATTGAELVDVHISEPSLENLFLHHTGRSLRD